jgi:acyl-CoA-binding protein
MTNQDLSKFQEAVAAAIEMTQASLPQDCVFTRSINKTFGHVDLQQSATYHLRDAFKINAWMQISHLTADEAKEYYIEIINSILKK